MGENIQKDFAGREKYWSELSIEEKIERMRSVIKGADDSIRSIRSTLDRLEQHSHRDDGTIVVPFHDGRTQGMVHMGRTEPGKEWF